MDVEQRLEKYAIGRELALVRCIQDDKCLVKRANDFHDQIHQILHGWPNPVLFAVIVEIFDTSRHHTVPLDQLLQKTCEKTASYLFIILHKVATDVGNADVGPVLEFLLQVIYDH